MKSLLFLLILDFSGSMYQRVHQDVKYELLQRNVSALLKAAENEDAQSVAGVLTFGLHPRRKCADLTYEEHPVGRVTELVNGYRPGAFSKTPLAEALARGTRTTLRKQVRRVVIFSDGADSCGKDPCEQLKVSNEQLKKAGRVMEMAFIGIDLKKEAAKFECFKHSLSHIKIQYSEIEDAFQAQEALMAQHYQLKNRVRAPFGTVEVRGAPPSVRFHIQKHSWFGSFRYKIRHGHYTVQSDFPGSRAVDVQVGVEEERKIFWEDFFLKPESEIKGPNKTLTVLLTPLGPTVAAHRKTEPVLVRGLLQEKPWVASLPFGSWSAEVLSPPWIRVAGQKQILNIDPLSSKEVDFFSLFGLQWTPVPEPALRHVISFESKGPRYLLQEGIERIPVAPGQNVIWMNY